MGIKLCIYAKLLRCTVTVSLVFIILHFFSLLTSLSPFQLLLSPLSSVLWSLNLASLTQSIQKGESEPQLVMTSRPDEANHGGFSGTGLGLINGISALENRNHSEACYYQWTMLVPLRSQYFVGFWSRFFVGFGIFV